MNPRPSVAAFVAMTLFASALSAQQDAGGRINFIYILSPKQGMVKQFEEAMKKHQLWHAAQKDARSIGVSAVVAGDGVGQYRVVYGNLRWEDQDRAAPFTPADFADVGQNVAPFLESTRSLVSFRMDSLSRIPATEPAKNMNWVTYTYVRAGKTAEYANYLRRLREAHDKANSPYRYFVLNVILGGDTPAYATVRPADKWADFTPAQNRDVLVKAYGELEADRLLNVLDDVVRRTSSFVTVRRPDLSYTPGGQ
ncbi:MAG: hypothetical protein ACKVZ0_08695 [Gemmatimonadales bacterium]